MAYMTSLYSIESYLKCNYEFIKNNAIIFNNINTITQCIQAEDKAYHIRIHNNKQYILFGDLDGLTCDIDHFITLFQEFMFNNYNLSFDKNDFKYTKNNIKENSYHYSIPKWNLSTENLKNIHNKFKNSYKKILDSSIIDTTIYSEHWWRYPYQRKGMDDKTLSKHIIVDGNIEDFIVDYIPKYSIDINNIIEQLEDKQIKNNIIIKKNNEQSIIDIKKETDLILDNNYNCNTYNNNKKLILTNTMSEPLLYKKIFNECYKQDRFDRYEFWIAVGMALKNIFHQNEKIAFEIFNYYSKKGNNYEGEYITYQKFKSFIIKQNSNKSYTVGTIYGFALEDNKYKFIEIMKQNELELEQTDICKYIKIIAGNRFLYIKDNGVYKLYCFNGKYWVNDDIIMKNFISNELYEFLKNILKEIYFEHNKFCSLYNQLKKLKTHNYKNDIVKTYKEVGTRDDIIFDDKWWLLGFNNGVYDMEEGVFRDYRYEDYISITTGYDWQEPSSEEINFINNIINQIMPIPEERELYLQILATTLDGRALEKFIIFNGGGGNGKGVMNDLLLTALGNYALIGNNSILFEQNRTGSNPEKANIHKKRLVIFREPSERNKFENSVVKELTGGGKFSARSHHEHTTEKNLNLTLIVECNKRPLFQDEPQNAEIRRLIDLYFRSTYTENNELIDEKNNIYKANPYFKTSEFQQKYKFALLKILMNEHYKFYKINKSILIPPKSVNERSLLYLELSCNIVQWFKDNYVYTEDKNDIIKIKDLYAEFVISPYFANLTKAEKKKYNKSFFVDYIQSNLFFRKFYVERKNNIRNIILQWKKNDECENE
jgi:phage/plasmid-associated DNA primase